MDNIEHATHANRIQKVVKAPETTHAKINHHQTPTSVEQMELVQQRLAQQSKKKALKPADHNLDDDIDTSRARTINKQMDWECGGCGALNFARVVFCRKCKKRVGPDTTYLTNRLNELKQERFARAFRGPGPALGRDGDRSRTSGIAFLKSSS